MHLEKASEHPPADLAQFLRELGHGEAGFGGTSFGNGKSDLPAFLQSCIQGEDPAQTPPEFVPQTIFWMIDAQQVVGMVRMRHRLNQRLLQNGGHVGYYVRPAERGKGYATLALKLAVDQLKKMGVTRVLVTVSPTNIPSTRTVLANGGIQDGQGRNPDTEEIVNRYWIESPD
jgi:predicted acetyltransferase